jgi:hypothetical protein
MDDPRSAGRAQVQREHRENGQHEPLDGKQVFGRTYKARVSRLTGFDLG